MTGPVASDSESSLDRAAELALLEFGLPPSTVDSMDRLPQGIKNLNYRVRASGEDWVLKCHRGAGVAERLAFTHRLELTLAAAGLPVARPQQVGSGSTVVQTEAGIFTLHGWVAGQQISIADRDSVHTRHPALASELGSMLGALHRQGDAVLGETPRVVDVEALLAGPRRSVPGLRHGRPQRFLKSSRLLLRPSKNEFDRWILRNLDDVYRRAALLASPHVAAEVDPADVVVAHNDLNWENLVFGPTFEVVAVLDFDNAAVLPRALDVGAAAAVLVGADEPRLEQFLASYSQATGKQVDLTSVQVGMQWKCARSIRWSIDSYLSGRVADTELVDIWCRHLYDCLRALPPISSADSARA